MKCDLHIFWEKVYEWSDHFHRDPVANIVCYSSICLFFSFISIVVGAPAYALLDKCNLADGSNLANGYDSCHIMIPFALACFTLCISAIGIAAGEIHKSILYSIFGGLAFIAIWFEIYAFVAVMQQVVGNGSAIPKTPLALACVTAASHFIALICIFQAIRYTWLVNYHFTRQDKMIEAEKSKAEAKGKQAKTDFTIAKSKVEDDEIKTSGLAQSADRVKRTV